MPIAFGAQSLESDTRLERRLFFEAQLLAQHGVAFYQLIPLLCLLSCAGFRRLPRLLCRLFRPVRIRTRVVANIATDQ